MDADSFDGKIGEKETFMDVVSDDSSESVSISSIQAMIDDVLSANFDAISKPALQTICKYVHNILQNPQEEKHTTKQQVTSAKNTPGGYTLYQHRRTQKQIQARQSPTRMPIICAIFGQEKLNKVGYWRHRD